MRTLPPSVRSWCATPPTDLRRGFDGRAAWVRTQLQAEPLSGPLFVFCNRRADRLKLRYGDRDGLCLWYKRPEQGRLHFPSAPSGHRELTPGQLQRILDGVALEPVRRFNRYQRPTPA